MADVVVVGGGTAGCAVAAHLCAVTDARVTLFEAGDQFAHHPVNLFTSMSRPGVLDTSLVVSAIDHGERYGYLQAQVLGGGSAVNGLIVLPGAIDDFNEWCERDGLSEWSWDHVAPWFDIVATPTSLVDETSHSSVAQLLSDAWSKARPVPLALVSASRQSADSDAFRHAQATGRLSLRLHTAVSRIRFTGSRATGVDLVDGSLVEASCVVVCAGALRTPILLRQSGVDISGLGENLQDHPNIMFTGKRRVPFVEQVPISRYVAFKSDGDASAPDVAHVLGYEQIDAEGKLAGIGVSLMDVYSRGAIVESSTGSWTADFRCLSDARDRKVFVDIVRQVATEVVEQDLEATFHATDARHLSDVLTFLVTKSDEKVSSWLDHNVRTLSHAAGTCAMGVVCDGKGRVADIDDLWVADASLMPRIVRANTNETVAMMATRVSQFVAETLEG